NRRSPDTSASACGCSRTRSSNRSTRLAAGYAASVRFHSSSTCRRSSASRKSSSQMVLVAIHNRLQQVLEVPHQPLHAPALEQVRAVVQLPHQASIALRQVEGQVEQGGAARHPQAAPSEAPEVQVVQRCVLQAELHLVERVPAEVPLRLELR